jgi:hypothetical protein
MQITFTAADGKRITVADPRREADGDVSLPEVRDPAAWIVSQMAELPEGRSPSAWITSQLQVDASQARNPAVFMVSQMRASLPVERRPAGWIAGTMKV